MPEIPNWNQHLVVQKDPRLGCIPAGYEWMLRVVNCPDIDFNNFQNDFNIQANGKGDNNFVSIANAVQARYPHVHINHQEFLSGNEKIDHITRLIEGGAPCLISLTLQDKGGWHIMPVVYIDNDVVRTIWSVDSGGRVKMSEISILEIVRRHEFWPGGKDVAWLNL